MTARPGDRGSGSAPKLTPDDVVDVPESWEVVASKDRFQARVISVRTDSVTMPEGEPAERDYVLHPGSVAVVALDDAGRVLLLRQYRHPVRRLLWEIPAGLRDVAGESLLDNARRELAEEAGYRAATWHTLVDLFTSPGMANERMRIFLARDVEPIPDGEFAHERRHEEIDMPVVWVPLEEAVAKALSGKIHNSQAVAGILAAYAASAGGFADLRPADAPED
ncbi:NUDIX hydrolase [Thermopolyspora flexuosa]|uniref:ADP-ribose pyrophosphatase n=1 Tax=Thermopolyspora flexuosa TaxID=103836 RepID=A0A543IZF8_9ACTN|nr:NUDIX hydrolase [Thermopolyspora flexuosa]TQM75948.1 ADP-ribose pyrophosphatase [Thermopolyspora flexuosa]GGM63451.1 NUDIX hydrolase [Thermopolyspora flexuosa]